MLYPILKRFGEMGVVTKQIELQEGKPNRNTYTITDLGIELMFELLQDFPARRKILQTRKAVVERHV